MGRTQSGIRTLEITYDALPSQKRFHACKARFKGFSGPVGSGKSQALCQEAIRLSYQNPGLMGLLGAPTYAMLRDATQTALLNILGQNDIPFEHNKAESVLVMKDSGSRILLRSMDEFERLRGTNLAWFGLDELTYTPEEAWLRLEGRLREPNASKLCGFAAWTPKVYDWVYRRFIDPNTRTKGYEAIIAPPQENRHLLNANPDFYKHLRESYDQRFYEQEVLGNYLSMDGSRVYPAFDRNLHVSNIQLNPALPLLWTLDFNVDPMSSLVAQVGNNEIYVLDEIFLRHSSTHQACAAFLERYGRHSAGLTVFGDASGFAQQTTGNSDYDVVKEYFRATSTYTPKMNVPRSNPGVRDRVNVTNGRLMSASGDIHLLVDPKCKELIQDLEQVSYKSGSGSIDKDRDRMRTHLSDALGYLLWQVCTNLPSIGEQNHRVV
jgi:hypothetical protein